MHQSRSHACISSSGRVPSVTGSVGAESLGRPSVFERLGHGRNSAPSVFGQTPLNTDYANYLPVVQSKLRDKLANVAEFIDFAELLRLRGQLPGTTTIRADPDNPDGVLVSSAARKDPICSFSSWMRAFYIFASYRIHYYAHLTQPLFKYADIIATLPDSVHSY